MSTKLDEFQETFTIPEEITVTMKKQMMQIQGPLGKTFKSFRKIPVDVEIKEKDITLKAQGKRKKDYSIFTE